MSGYEFHEKNMKKILFSILAIGMTLMYSATFAQDTTNVKGNCGHHMMGPGPQVMTAEQVAKAETDRMQKELQLTDQQYKKVYKANLAEAKVLTGGDSKKSSGDGNGEGFPQGGPMGGGPGGMGPGGMGPGGMGPGGMGNGEIGQGQKMHQRDTTGMKQGHKMMPNMGPKCTPQQAKAAKDKKMEKLKDILSEYQYNIYDKQQTEKEMKENCPFGKEKKDSNSK